MYLESARSANRSDSPQSFISLKNGRWRPVDVPPGTLAVMYRGLWRAVFRAASNEEYFAAHPDAKFRLNLRVTRVSRRYSFFSFKIATRDGEVYATGDSGDVGSDLRRGPGTARERWIRACLLMLTDPHRCTGPVMKSPYWNWKPNHKMTDAELWHFAMSVIEPDAGARQ